MSYADFAFYREVYLGTAIAEADFPALAGKASAYVDYVTLGRAKTAAGEAAEAVRLAVCALSEVMQDGQALSAVSASTDRPLASETVGGWSRSYGSRAVSGQDLQLLESRKREAAAIYLAPYGLLRARGYGPCPCSPTP